MPVNSKLLEVLPEDYGYVILVAIGTNLFNMYLARNVMKARKEFGVEVGLITSKIHRTIYHQIDSIKIEFFQKTLVLGEDTIMEKY